MSFSEPHSFVHLRAHTEYSIRDGLLYVEPWLEKIAQLQMPAVAMTDHCNLFGLIKFYKQAVALGVKPIIGADIPLVVDNECFIVTLLCQNPTGYKNLLQLLSRAYLEGQNSSGEPTVQWDWLAALNSGLIVLSGGKDGDVGRALLSGQKTLILQRVQRWQETFPQRFYLELQRTGRSQEEIYIEAALEVASAHQIPVVATNDVRFLAREDFLAHEARVCIHAGHTLADPKRPQLYSEQQYLRSPAEMAELFADIPEALANTVAIAQRCTAPLALGEVHLPNFPLPEGHSVLSDYLANQAQQGLEAIVQKHHISEEKTASYRERLKTELSVINRMGFAGYFLIVADFIRWSKQQDIPVGPGRGSGAGSLVAYTLGITELDPLQHDLLFERFLNPERVSMPDFDIDFCMEGRDRVIEYVAERYGREAVSQIITFGTMAAKAVVRDVGRVLGMPYGFVDKVAKLIPFELGMTLEKALAAEEQLAERYKNEEEVASLIDLAKKLEGVTRNAGKHAGGVVIAPTKLTDFTPLYCEPGGHHPVTQFDKDDVESAGLIKFDFLGLRTLTIIHWAVETINKKKTASSDSRLDISQIPLDDLKTFDLLKHSSTTAIFQLESRGMKELVRRLQPGVFEEITALVALFRPGPLQSGMVDDFIARKHGQAKVEYAHPDLEPILRTTYGVILYQEQVMQIAQVLSGYSLGEADILRRAMGKKKPEEMYKQREKFITGAEKRGIQRTTAAYIFDLMEKFAGYGFNKSHSAAYALISYQTAWLKAHYPAEFMAAVLSSDLDNTDKVVGFIVECRQMGLTVSAPNIQRGHYRFTVDASGCIEYGLGAIKGVGQSAVEHFTEEREKNGFFKDLFDFCQRLDHRKINRRVLESLIYAGAMDIFDCPRATLLASIDAALKSAEKHHLDQSLGQGDLFFAGNEAAAVEYVKAAPWPDFMRLQKEKEVLGYYFSGHPLQSFEQELSALNSVPIARLEKGKQNAVCGGVLIQQRVIQTRKGTRMAVIKLEDMSGTIEVTIFSKLYDQVKLSLQADQIYVVRGNIEEDTYTGGVRIVAESIDRLSAIRTRFARHLKIKLNDSTQAHSLMTRLPALLQPHCGGRCDIVITYQGQEADANLRLGENWRVTPTDELLEKIRAACPADQLVIGY